MSEETRKVLEMLAEGKINAADAERLLDKLSAPPEIGAKNGNAVAGLSSVEKADKTATAGKKFLRVLIERPGETT